MSHYQTLRYIIKSKLLRQKEIEDARLVEYVNGAILNAWISNQFPWEIDVMEPPNPLCKQIEVCECGKDKHDFASHSDWCAKYEANR